MADWPVIPWSAVSWRIGKVSGDGDDVDLNVDVSALGLFKVTLTPSYTGPVTYGQGDNIVTLFIETVVGYMDTDGFLMRPDVDDPNRAGTELLHILPSDLVEINPKPIIWTASFNYKGEPFNVRFAPKAGETVNLSDFVKIPANDRTIQYIDRIPELLSVVEGLETSPGTIDAKQKAETAAVVATNAASIALNAAKDASDSKIEVEANVTPAGLNVLGVPKAIFIEDGIIPPDLPPYTLVIEPDDGNIVDPDPEPVDLTMYIIHAQIVPVGNTTTTTVLSIPSNVNVDDVMFVIYKSQATTGPSTVSISGFVNVDIRYPADRIYGAAYKIVTENDLNGTINISYDLPDYYRRIVGLVIIRNVLKTNPVSYAVNGQSDPGGARTPSVSNLVTPFAEIVIFTNENNDGSNSVPTNSPAGLTRLTGDASYNSANGLPEGENPGTPTTLYIGARVRNEKNTTVSIPSYANVFSALPGRIATLMVIPGRTV